MERIKSHKIFGSLILMLAVISLSNCKDDDLDQQRNYELVWSDEFNGDSASAVGTDHWTYDLGTGNNGWGNNELQTYTNNAENISMDGQGNLKITAIKKSSTNYTSARIKTQNLFGHKYGRIEARIKTPAGQGIWPAFWMLGENIDNVGWPQCGEIDIMEQKGQYPFITYGSLHGPGYSAGNAITNSYRLETGRYDDGFYIYAVEWGEDYIEFYINDILYGRVTPSDLSGEWVYDQEFFILLNVAVGGSFVGPPTDNTPFPASMYIDYVRVYKEV